MFSLLIFILLSTVAVAQEVDSSLVPIENLSGREIYLQFCSRCHGLSGKGDVAPEIVENMNAPLPEFTSPYFNSREKRKDWIAVIKHGGQVRGLSSAMPAWGEAFSDRQIEETVEYLKSFVDQSRFPQGELNFIRAHSVSKAFVEQEALLIPTYTVHKQDGVHTTTWRSVVYYANRFGNRSQYEMKLPLYLGREPKAKNFGVGDLELGLKHCLYDDYRSREILSAGLEFSLPTGSERMGFGSGALIVSPYIAAGKEMSGIVQLQTSLKLERPLKRKDTAGEFLYALSGTVLTTDEKRGLFPGLEVAGKYDLSHGEQSISLIPKIYWSIPRRGHLAISVGAEIPIAGEKAFDRRIVAFFLWDYVDGGLW